MRSIDLRKINEYCVNEILMEAVRAEKFEADANEIALVKISLKYCDPERDNVPFIEARKRNKPFYAFYKSVGKNKAAIYRIDNGKVVIVSTASISKRDEVKGSFKLWGVTYAPKDTVNGFRRFGIYNN